MKRQSYLNILHAQNQTCKSEDMQTDSHTAKLVLTVTSKACYLANCNRSSLNSPKQLQVFTAPAVITCSFY